MTPLALVVLAAGMGSRYGGLKQLDPVGPSGETMLDYSVYDALRAGFSKVVFVIRRDFEKAFRETIAAKYTGRVAVDYVFQSLGELPASFAVPAGREKPWGTGHATWCARAAVKEPFAVINADDFYGAESYRALARFLERAAPNEAAMVGFRLKNTLSESGAVSRGICQTDTAGKLLSVTERTGILPEQVGEGREFSPDTLVSMNCWGFTPALFRALEEEFAGFLTRELSQPATAAKAEFYLPAAISNLIVRGRLVADVLPSESSWFGVTYKDDKPRVVASIRTLISAGLYPENLWA
ncbi:MAG TPA: NTP transferase domain-containing protein [Opitutaceae bacterium]|nr:NTP transferase domain-containing protein [Opitutaceae bacterium]